MSRNPSEYFNMGNPADKGREGLTDPVTEESKTMIKNLEGRIESEIDILDQTMAANEITKSREDIDRRQRITERFNSFHDKVRRVEGNSNPEAINTIKEGVGLFREITNFIASFPQSNPDASPSLVEK